MWEVAFQWQIEDERALWTLANLQDGEPTDDGLSLEATDEDAYLWRQVSINAASVDRLRLVLADAEPRVVQVFWAGVGELFSENRQVGRRAPSRSLADGSAVYELQLAGRPGWSGQIGRLRIDPTDRAGDRLRILRVEGLRFRPPDAVEPWRVALGPEVRSAFAVTPGVPLELEARAPSTASLRFGYGLLEDSVAAGWRTEPVELRVSVASADQPGQAPSRSRVLFTAVFPAAGREAEPSWHTARIDLAEYGGQRLRLRAEAVLPDGGTEGFALLIADPEIYPAETIRRHPNVVLISIDTLRADHLSLYGYFRVTSPNLDAWARGAGVTFLNTVAASPWTLPSHVSMLTGVDALGHGVNYLDTSVSEDLLLLPEILRRHGYRTAAVTGGGFVVSKYGLDRGFERFRWWPGRSGDELELEENLDTALDWIEDFSDRPFFLFFHTYEVHSPFRRHEPHFSWLGGRAEDLGGERLSLKSAAAGVDEGFIHRYSARWERGSDGHEVALADLDPGTLASLYDTGILRVDGELPRLFERLRKLDLDRDTVVVFTSDHGESLGEHGLLSHSHLYDDNLKVPLVISYPRRLAGGQALTRQARTVDLMPTILDLAGLEIPPGLDGISLVPWIEGGEDGPAPPAWSYAGWPNRGLSLRLDNAQAYLLNDAPWPAICGHEEYYRLLEDPGQLRNLVATDPEVEPLRRRALDYLQQKAPGLILRFADREPEPLEVTFSGVRRLPWTLKKIAGSCPAIGDWQAQRLRIVIAPGAESVLAWQSPGSGPLEIALRLRKRGSGAIEHVVRVDDPASYREPRVLQLEYGAWSWTEARDLSSGTGLSLQWRPSFVRMESAAAEEDALETVQRQLEALGYVQ